MMARLYSNENFPLPAVVALRALGHDVLTSLEANRANYEIPDDQVLSFALEKNRAVLTFNRKDFIRLHRKIPIHAGIITCTENPDFPALAHKIHAQLQSLDSLQNQLIRVNRR